VRANKWILEQKYANKNTAEAPHGNGHGGAGSFMAAVNAGQSITIVDQHRRPSSDQQRTIIGWMNRCDKSLIIHLIETKNKGLSTKILSTRIQRASKSGTRRSAEVKAQGRCRHKPT
jgi:hypothetical protein